MVPYNIHSIVHGGLGGFQFGAAVNNAADNIPYMSFGKHRSVFLGDYD